MPHPDLEGGNPMPGMCHSSLTPATNFTNVHGRWPPQPASVNTKSPLRPLRGETDDSDSSWTLYSMYSNIAEKEDAEMVERCQKDKDGTLVFVSLRVSSQTNSAH